MRAASESSVLHGSGDARVRRSSEIDLDSVVSARSDLTYLPYEDVTVVVGSRAATLNPAALSILRSLDGTRTLASAAAHVATRFDLPVEGIRGWMVPAAVGFARAALLVGVEYDSGEHEVEHDAGEGDGDEELPDQRGLERSGGAVAVTGGRPGAPLASSCAGKRLHLAGARFIDVQVPGGALAVSCDAPDVAAAIEEHFGPVLGPPARYGLGVVSSSFGATRGPLFDVFDGTGYRIWRGRGVEELLRALASLMLPFVPEAGTRRAFFDFRRLVRDGKAVLVDPRLIEDIKVMRAVERLGWSIPPAVFSEIDLDSRGVVVREPLDPAHPTASRIIDTLPILGFGMHVKLEAGNGLGPVVEGLANAHLPSKVSATLVDSLPAIQLMAQSTVARWPLFSGTAHQLPFLTELLTDARSARRGPSRLGASAP